MKAKLNLFLYVLLIFCWLKALMDFIDISFKIALCNYPAEPFVFYWIVFLILLFIFPIISALNAYIFVKENRQLKPKNLKEWKKALK